MIDLNSKRMLAKDFNAAMNEIIDKGFCEIKEEPRQYLGCSLLGAECERYIQYEAIQALYPESRKEFACETPARVQRIFERGHVFEDMAAMWFINAGYFLETLDKRTGRQFEISYFDGAVKGHCDGIFTYHREQSIELPLPSLWENKAINAKYFKAISSRKTKSVYPKYFAQVQLYMHGLGLEHALISYINADSMEIHFELIPYEEEEAIYYLERTRRILDYTKRGEYIPKKSASPAELVCKFCNYNKICWE